MARIAFVMGRILASVGRAASFRARALSLPGVRTTLVLASLCACSDGGTSSGTAPGAQIENLQLAFDRLDHGGELTAFTVDEANQGSDHNGGGDSVDEVLHVYDVTTAATTNLGLAVRGFRVDGRRAVFQVSELRHGPSDFNGDGLLQGAVLHVVRVR